MASHARPAAEVAHDRLRLAALRRTALLDTPGEEAFDRLTRLAARLVDAPVALLTLVDGDRQFFKSCIGLDDPWGSRRETPLSHSFCQHAVASGEPLVVEDARTHPDLQTNLAIPDLGVVSYLGVPLVIRSGEAIGAFCVIDHSPRVWGDDAIGLVTDLAAAAVTEIELRVQAMDQAAARRRLAVQYAVARVLAESTDVEEAVRDVVRAVSVELDWELGAVWHVRGDVLEFVEAWHPPASPAAGFAAASRGHVFARGEGFPGRVWQAGGSDWLPDITETDFPRASSAESAGLRAAVGFPLVVEGEVSGVLEFFATTVREADGHLLALLDAIASQLGQFLERQRADGARRASEARTRAVVDSALDCVVTIDHVGRVLEFNPAAERTFGYGREEILGRVMADLIVPPDFRDAHWTGFRRYLDSREGRILDRRLELEAIDASGRRFPIELAVTRVDVPGEPVFTAYLRDITDRRRGEDERERLLRELEARANAARVLEHTSDGVLMVDREERVLLWNPAAERITGIGADAVVGRRARDTIPGWARISESVDVSPGEQEHRPHTVPLEIDHHELWLSFSGAAFAEGTVYAFRDASDEHRLERMRTDFVATASHELRTPLAAISGAALTLTSRERQIDPTTQEALFEMIVSQSERLRVILDRLLLAARIDSPEFRPAVQPVDVAAVVRNVLDAVRQASAGVPITLDLPDETPRVAGDAEQLRQVVSNLVDNAIKYAPPLSPIRISVEPADGRVRIAVRDSGIGIPASERERIFEKFYRLDPNLSRGVPGTGLGLYIARELVRRMHGRVHVEANGGRGSAFIVELPLTP